MSTKRPQEQTSVIAVYQDHESAESAVRQLQIQGFPMESTSIIGRDFQTVEKPIGFITSGTEAKEGAKVGAWTGGFFGLLMGAAFLVLPGLGPVIIAGPLAATVLGGVEGALAGAAFGGLSGALVGLGFSKEGAIRYESEVKAGKFLLAVKCDPALVEKATAVLRASSAETTDVARA